MTAAEKGGRSLTQQRLATRRPRPWRGAKDRSVELLKRATGAFLLDGLRAEHRWIRRSGRGYGSGRCFGFEHQAASSLA